MVSRGAAWWMTRTKGIYVYSLSPFRQRAFAGFPREMAQIARQHWRGTLAFSGMCAAVYGLGVWADRRHHANLRKDPAFYEKEWVELQAAREAAALAAAEAAESEDADEPQPSATSD